VIGPPFRLPFNEHIARVPNPADPSHKLCLSLDYKHFEIARRRSRRLLTLPDFAKWFVEANANPFGSGDGIPRDVFKQRFEIGFARYTELSLKPTD
jgi:hypothetical protein